MFADTIRLIQGQQRASVGDRCGVEQQGLAIDSDLAQLVSMGGWIRGTEVLTSVVQKNYSQAGAELLHKPQLINYFTNRLDGIKNTRLGKDELVVRTAKMLLAIRPLIGKDDGSKIPVENVQRINKMTAEMVAAITSPGA